MSTEQLAALAYDHPETAEMAVVGAMITTAIPRARFDPEARLWLERCAPF